LIETEHGRAYRDLNKNGKLDVYEDSRQPVEARVEDLLSQMTLEEKAGTMFINGAVVNPDGTLEEKPGGPGFGGIAIQGIDQHKMNHFNLWEIPGVEAVAAWYNRLQQYAEKTRLGIPITIASDPRNHFNRNIFALAALEFSQWCETLGFAAIGDPDLVKQFADIVRREYLAVGIRVALHPQIDLATEPRWPRISGTFGEDAHLSARLVKSYIEGFQGDNLGPQSVACMTKHFPGGGPQNEGLDPHFEFQKGQIYPGNNFDYHLIPFEAAIESKTAAMMPYYGVPVGQTDEDVAMSYNKTIITDLLREKYQYDDVVCTDWGLITDLTLPETVWPARAWGVEHLTEIERVLKVIEAGVDQFGGESCPEYVVELVNDGRLSEDRIDESVRRLLALKFQLGLFDDPFIDEAQVPEVFGDENSRALSFSSQQRAMTLLKNEADILPLENKPKVFIQDMDTAVVSQFAQVVEDVEQADLAILRLNTPWVPVDTKNPFARGFHHGDLAFKDEQKAEILSICNSVPTVVVINLDRPAVIPQITEASKALLGEFGASDEAVMGILFGKVQPEGNLPFELPSSMDAVRRQKPDVPYDSEDPLFEFGFGLRYK
jgi:beta-glucosidase